MDDQRLNGASVGDGVDRLGEILGTLRGRIAEAQGPDAVAEQQYLLGVAYGRVGRYDDAKVALAAAVSGSARYRFPAAALLGRIYRDEGSSVDAVEWFERAAEVTAPTPDEAWTLLYHLGTTLDAMEDRARALAVFLELRGIAGPYRDVEQRVTRLTTMLLGG